MQRIEKFGPDRVRYFMNSDLRRGKKIPKHVPRLTSSSFEEFANQLAAKVDRKLNTGEPTIEIVRSGVFRKKAHYKIREQDLSSWLISKEVEADLHRVLKYPLFSRNELCAQLYGALDRRVPLDITRLDVQSCFESIPHQQLLSMINENPSIPTLSKQLLAATIREFEKTTGRKVGLPRGTAIASVLAEFYLQAIDREFIKAPDTGFYARYVDDRIHVKATIKHSSLAADYFSLLSDSLTDVQLKPNLHKSKTFHWYPKGPPETVEFLGYQYRLSDPRLSVGMSESRKTRYRKRVEKSCRVFRKGSQTNADFRLLDARLRYLTSNPLMPTNQIAHSNRGDSQRRVVLSGVYFSNPLLAQNCDDLVELDKFLTQEINLLSLENSKESHLLKHSFVTGFETRRVYAPKPKSMTKITSIWTGSQCLQ